jgi:general bacterial porin, GBP family
MKKSLLALAVLGAFAGSAMAQSSVTLYGVADANFTSAKGGTNRLNSLGSGGLNGSRFGLRGTEDLGGGLKANFVLENGFSIDTGAQGNTGTATATQPTATGQRLFGRQAFVGLSGGFGEIRLGRQYSLVGVLTDELGPLGTKGADLFAVQNSSGNRFYRIDNAVTYMSPNLGGLTVNGQYSFQYEGAEQNKPNKNAGVSYGASVAYKGGPVQAGLGYIEIKDNQFVPAGNGNQKVTGLLGYVGVTFAGITVKGAYDQVDNDTAKDRVIYGLSVEAPVGPFALAAGVAKAKDTTGAANVKDDATLFNVQAVYNLSKRTALYTFYTRVSNGDFAALGYNGPAIDKNSDQFQIGVRHRF